MQIGVITVDGRQIGVVTWAAGSTPDPTVPDLYDGGDLPQGRITQASLGDYTSDHARVGHELHHGGEGVAPGNIEHKHHHWPDHRERNFPAAGGGGGGDRVYGRFAEARDRARAELKSKPWLNEKAMHIFAGENRDPTASTALWESAINRMAVRGTSLEKELRRSGEGGYYAGWSGDVDPHTRSVLEASRDRALNYSNVSRYATDNSSNQPGNHLADRDVASGRFTERSVYHGEHFEAPLGESAKWNKTWNSMVYESEAARHAPSAPATGAANAPSASPVGSGKANDALNWMKQREGLQENRDRSELRSDMGGFDPATEAWCAQFVNSALRNAGIKSSGSAVANSFQRWGNRVGPDDVKAGDVAVMTRGRGADQTGGHVGMATGATRVGSNGQRQFEMEAGNDANRVRRTWHNLDDPTIHFRRAPSDGGEKVAAKPFDPETMVP
jgi:hypothetical protein